MKASFTGRRDKRGDWRPDEPIELARLLAWSTRPLAILKWLFGYPGYFLPWGILYMVIPIITWEYLTPPLAQMTAFAPWWTGYVLVRNYGITLAVVGAWYIRLYLEKAQGTDFKYTGKWLAPNNPIFLFRNQFFDNIFWTVISAVPIWTAYEVITLWLYANHLIPYVSFREHPIYCVAMMCAIPLLRDVHFYAIHRLIHWRPLYEWIHYLHHNTVNVGPVTGLSMHPVEHLLYFSGVVFHWIVPSHPIHALFHLQHAALTPAQGYAGFERAVLLEGVEVKTHDFFHYLHESFASVTGSASWLNVAASLGIVALPMGLLMIAGELDLSIGSAELMDGGDAVITSFARALERNGLAIHLDRSRRRLVDARENLDRLAGAFVAKQTQHLA